MGYAERSSLALPAAEDESGCVEMVFLHKHVNVVRTQRELAEVTSRVASEDAERLAGETQENPTRSKGQEHRSFASLFKTFHTLFGPTFQSHFFSMTRACPLSHNPCLGDQSNLPSPDVSRRLPAELLASIFIHIAHDSYIDEKYSFFTPTRPSWVNVSYVCRYWRDVALNCPTIWSYIPATSQRWTKELLARSQMAPLKISMKVESRILPDFFHRRQPLKPAHVLSIVEQVTNHSQRIQKLRLDVGIVHQEIGYQILSKFLFTPSVPCLQHVEISHFELPEGKIWLLFKENTPALRTLGLKFSWIPWYALGPSGLTTLHLSHVGFLIPENTMANFLAMLRCMPHLVQLSIHNTLPSARDSLANGEFDATPMISLPHLSNVEIVMVPLSAATALVSCVDIPLRTKFHLTVEMEEDTSTLDDCVQLASLLRKRIGQSDSPKFRSLTIGSPGVIALAFSTSERVECYSSDSLFSIKSDDNALLKFIFSSAGPPMNELDFPALSSICNQIPLTDIHSVHFLGSSLEPEFWRDVFASLSDVRHIRFSHNFMPNIIPMLSLPSHYLTRSRQDGRIDRGQDDVFVPALEELELYQTTLDRVRGTRDPNPYIADIQALYDAIATRKETRCRLTIKECRLGSDGGVAEALESVGWWESTEFRVTSNVRYDRYW